MNPMPPIAPGTTEWVDLGRFDVEMFLASERTSIRGISYEFVYDRKTFTSWFTHVDEHAARSLLWSGIAAGDVVMDVGAGSGSYTLPALAQGAAHVYAFCPSGPPDPSIDILLRSLDQNGWRDGRCEILPFGLNDSVGRLTLGTGATIPVTTLDALDAETLHLTRLDWIKIDVEGAEVAVLRGGLETFRRFRPRLMIENHLFMDRTMEERVKAVIAPLGYVVSDEMLKPDNSVSHVLWAPGVPVTQPRPQPHEEVAHVW